MKKVFLIIMAMMMMLSVFSVAEAAAKKPKSPPAEQASIVTTDSVGNPISISTAPATTAATTYSSATATDENSGSAHISPALDTFINNYLIPMLVVVFGLIWRKIQKERLSKILFMGYNLWKEVDNMFASPAILAEHQGKIDSLGLYAVKKAKTVELINKSFSAPQLSLATKIAGNIPAYVELIGNAFKIGSPLASKLIKQIKKW